MYLEDLSVVGVEEEDPTSFSIYPNPANQTCTLQFDANMFDWTEIVITDLAGKEMMYIDNSFNQITANSVLINVGDLSNGIYFVTVRNSTEQLTEKLIIGQ